MVAKFLSKPESTHLMFIDADIGWEPWHLLLLLHHDKDVIGGMYPLKGLPIKWCVNGIEGGEEEEHGSCTRSKQNRHRIYAYQTACI